MVRLRSCEVRDLSPMVVGLYSQGGSSRQIASYLSVPKSTILNILNRNGAKIRTMSQAKSFDLEKTTAAFWEKVNKNGPVSTIRPDLGRCWLWTGAAKSGGNRKYGRVAFMGRMRPVHQVSYELVKGTLPVGHVPDHLCKNEICVNPDHLEAVTHRENNRRSESPSALNARKTLCPKGHALAGKNLYVHSGKRSCKICRALAAARHRAKRRSNEKGFVFTGRR